MTTTNRALPPEIVLALRQIDAIAVKIIEQWTALMDKSPTPAEEVILYRVGRPLAMAGLAIQTFVAQEEAA